MKKRNQLLKLCIGLLIITSCEKNNLDTPPPSEGDGATEILQWYNQNKPKDDNWLKDTEPNWSDVYLNDRDSILVYEVPLINANAVLSSSDKASKTNFAELQKKNNITLIFVKNKKSNSIAGYYMNVISKNNPVDWDKVHYASPVGVSGMLNYHSMDGTFLNGWLVEDGKIINSLRKKSSFKLIRTSGASKSSPDNPLSSARTTSYSDFGGSCGNILVNDYQLSCVTAGEVQTCEPYIANSYTVYVPCTSENDPDGPGTAGDPGGMGEPDPWENPDNYNRWAPTTEQIVNTPVSPEVGEFEIDGCNFQMDSPDEKNPQKGSPSTIAKVNFQIKTKRGTVITEWTDNSGRVHAHMNFGTFYNGFFKSFKEDLLKIGTGVNFIFDMFKSGKIFVSPTSWAGFYGSEADYVVDEMQEYYKAKKEYNQKNGTKCNP